MKTAMLNTDRLLERFLRYVQMDTTANDASTSYPSSAGQLALGKLLTSELRQLGLDDAVQDQHGIVTATIPATAKKATPVVALNSHLDTSPETTGAGVKPQVIQSYAGGDITLPGNERQVIRVDENPELKDLTGATLITTDGTTLLGADDKAGVAVILETAAYLVEHPEHLHGSVRLCFTCDEEIGHGVDHVDLNKLGATVCYTLDGQGAGEIDVETFSADLATVKFQGRNIHPSIAKGRMVNAVRAAAAFVDRLPKFSLSPESTSDRQGFLHPYQVEGGVGEVTLKVLLRDFDTNNLAVQADLLRQIARACQVEFPGIQIEVKVLPQYRNMADGLRQEPRAVDYAVRALEQLDRTPKLTIVRGGTDGSRFTELGLPTPNLSTGQHNPHSPLEWACLDEMHAAGQMLVRLLEIWAEAS